MSGSERALTIFLPGASGDTQLWRPRRPHQPGLRRQRLAQLLPHAELVVIPGGTHELVAECVDDILPHVDRLLASQATYRQKELVSAILRRE